MQYFRTLTTILITLLTSVVWGAKIVNVACVGDSITEGLFASIRTTSITGTTTTSMNPTTAVSNLSYPSQLQDQLDKLPEKYFVFNLGSGGAAVTKNVTHSHHIHSYWTTWQYKELTQRKWDVIILMLGTNDTVFADQPGWVHYWWLICILGGLLCGALLLLQINWKRCLAEGYLVEWAQVSISLVLIIFIVAAMVLVAVMLGAVPKQSGIDWHSDSNCSALSCPFARSYLELIEVAKRQLLSERGIYIMVPPPLMMSAGMDKLNSVSAVNIVFPELIPKIAVAANIPNRSVISVFEALGGAHLNGQAIMPDYPDGCTHNGPPSICKYFCNVPGQARCSGDGEHPCDHGYQRIAEVAYRGMLQGNDHGNAYTSSREYDAIVAEPDVSIGHLGAGLEEGGEVTFLLD